MRVLAFDTSTEMLTMAVVNDEQLVGETTVRDPHGPTEHLALLLQCFLKQLDLDIHDMDGFAVGIGPGSWTGTRAGVTTAKVLAFATGRPLSGVSSFDALVYGSGIRDGRVCAVSDFGNDRLFQTTYEVHDGTFLRVTDYEAIHLEEMLRRTDKGTVFVGKGVIKHRQPLSELGLAVWPQAAFPTGRSVALLGLRSLSGGAGDDPFTLTPIYAALPQAEAAKQSRGP